MSPTEAGTEAQRDNEPELATVSGWHGKKCAPVYNLVINCIRYLILRALDAKHTSKIILEELGMGNFVMVREERIKGTKWILTALDMRVIAREHV